jgi:hypothetical protein
MNRRSDNGRTGCFSTRLLSAAAALVVLATALPLAADEWKSYSAPDYGFSMLVPEGATIKEKEWQDGWGGLFSSHDGLMLWGLAKLGKKYSAEEIEAYGVKLTGIPEDDWKEIGKGEDDNGWTWYRTVEATKGGTLIFGGYGVGPKGSYLLLLKTTVADYDAHKADYKKWYGSIKLK